MIRVPYLLCWRSLSKNDVCGKQSILIHITCKSKMFASSGSGIGSGLIFIIVHSKMRIFSIINFQTLVSKFDFRRIKKSLNETVIVPNFI